MEAELAEFEAEWRAIRKLRHPEWEEALRGIVSVRGRRTQVSRFSPCVSPAASRAAPAAQLLHFCLVPTTHKRSN